MRVGGERTIKAIRYADGKKPPLHESNRNMPVRKVRKELPAEKTLSDWPQTRSAGQAIIANTIDSPPIDGFVPWITVTATSKRGEEGDMIAETHTRITGSPLTNEPNNFVIGLFDTGASSHVMGNAAGHKLGIFRRGLLTPNLTEVIGVTGSVYTWVSEPLAIFIDGLDAIEPNSPAEPANLVLNTSGMVGQSNVSILVGDTPGPGAPDLPTAIGAPMAVNFSTSIRNDTPLTVNWQGETFTGPKIECYDPWDWNIPEYSTKVPLRLIPGGSIYVSYILDLEAIFDLIFRPGTPSIIAGMAYQSLFFVSSVDCYNHGKNAIDKDRFMFDTGAQVTVVGERIGARLGLNPGAPDFIAEVIGVTGEALDVPGFYIEKLEIPTLGEWLSYTNVPVLLLEIASPEGGTLDGIIGMNLFSEYNMVLHGDYVSPSLELEPIPQALIGDIAGTGDGVVDFQDFAVLARAWGTTAVPQSPNWNDRCDLAPTADPDGRIDELDLVTFAEHWLDRVNQ
ncbi:MAG: aspartyl protease family protein [Phycisphaerae bacterium]|nr:aspartyl protease family protein [Phycisphaerae bacterium]